MFGFPRSYAVGTPSLVIISLLTQPIDPEDKSLNFIFPTKHGIQKNLKFSHWLSEFVPTDNVLKVPVTSRDPLDTTGHLARVGHGAHDIAAASEGNVRHLMCKLGIFDHRNLWRFFGA